MRRIFAALVMAVSVASASGQELQAKVNVNHSKVGVTDVSIFENLQQTLEALVHIRSGAHLVVHLLVRHCLH